MKITDPATIDGSPHEVASESLDDLSRELTELCEAAEKTYAQLRNARLDEDFNPTGDTVLAWEASTEGRLAAEVTTKLIDARKIVGLLGNRFRV